MGEAIGEPGNAEPCCGRDSEGRAAVGLEAPLRPNRYDLAVIHELPGLGALQEGLMGGELLRRLRRTMRFDIVRACNQRPVDRPNASRDQVGVGKGPDADPTVETLGDEIDEAIAVGAMDVELRVAPRHLREHRREVCRAERKRHGNSQAAAKITGWEDRFLRRVDLGANPGCMVSKRGPRFCESGAAGRSRKKLDAEFRFKPEEPSTDDRLGDTEPARRGRNAPGIGHCHERLEVLDVQFGVPRFATRLPQGGTTASPTGSANADQATSPLADVARKTQCRSQRQERIWS